MNSIIYYILNRKNNARELEQEYLDDLYQYYQYGSVKLNYAVKIEQEDFQDVIRIIFSVLSLKLSDEDFRVVIDHYIKLLMADARDGNNVDITWFINHAWYLCVGISSEVETKKYRVYITFIQQKLIQRFNIKEDIKEKVSRKIYTSFMATC